MRGVFEELLIGLICLAVVAVFVSSSQGATAISSIGSLLQQLASNIVGTGSQSNAQ